MGAEIGATTSIFPFDNRMADYLRATDREEVAAAAEAVADHLMADPEVLASPQDYYDEIIEINLSELEPHIVGPHSPDIAHPVSQMASDVEANGYPDKLTAMLIGSCTNSSYEDIGRAAAIARQASAAGIKASMPFMVTPGSEQVRETIERDGLLADLEAIGATVLANACGPCIGQWDRTDSIKDEPNSIMTSYNRNFRARNDGSPTTNSFIASPEVVTAYALAGKLSADPVNNGITTESGETLMLEAPSAPELPEQGFDGAGAGYQAPPDSGQGIDVKVDFNSERLALLDPFESVDKVAAYQELPVLLKAVGKCTTDQISPAGKWLRFRGHLNNISDNMFSGADNSFSEAAGTGCNVFTGACGDSLSAIARDYKSRGQGWVAIGDSNYGEGSSREHAAMSPRYLGCRVVMVRSFARIHETNLKKQGVLPLTFTDASDYERINMDDRLTFIGLDVIEPGKPVQVRILHADGSVDEIVAQHSMNDEQISWFNAGSALNMIRMQQQD
jgi:aconitate hydratase